MREEKVNPLNSLSNKYATAGNNNNNKNNEKI